MSIDIELSYAKISQMHVQRHIIFFVTWYIWSHMSLGKKAQVQNFTDSWLNYLSDLLYANFCKYEVINV